MTLMPAAAASSAFDSVVPSMGDDQQVDALGDHVLDLGQLGRDVILGVLQVDLVARVLEALLDGVAVGDPPPPRSRSASPRRRGCRRRRPQPVVSSSPAPLPEHAARPKATTMPIAAKLIRRIMCSFSSLRGPGGPTPCAGSVSRGLPRSRIRFPTAHRRRRASSPRSSNPYFLGFGSRSQAGLGSPGLRNHHGSITPTRADLGGSAPKRRDFGHEGRR